MRYKLWIRKYYAFYIIFIQCAKQCFYVNKYDSITSPIDLTLKYILVKRINSLINYVLLLVLLQYFGPIFFIGDVVYKTWNNLAL